MPLDPDELRQKDIKELKDMLKDLQFQLLKLRAEARMGTLKNTASIRNTRKDIARILTIITEKQRGINKAKKEEVKQ